MTLTSLRSAAERATHAIVFDGLPIERIEGDVLRGLVACAEALERIMHARRDPASLITNMSRAGMRELAGETLSTLTRAMKGE